MAYIPHTVDDVEHMLKAMGLSQIETLFEEIPDALKINQPLNLPQALNEMQVTRLMQARANADDGYSCFLGAGAYDHYIPAPIWALLSRGEFMTAYTPYQAEASQGGLQAIYEFQTMIARLTAMDVANASVYDGATALAEALLMSVRANRPTTSSAVLVAGNLSPFYRQTVTTILSQQNIEVVDVPYDETTGCIDFNALTKQADIPFSALCIAQPNFFGKLEQVDLLTDWAHAKKLLVVACVNPVALALVKPPGEWGEKGADIACGEAQSLGVPLASGGPYVGFMSCKKALIRQLPGRIVGRTVDAQGAQGFTLTLQAREQHIRRAKARSNICTNQGLLALAATLYMSLMGAEGLRRVATHSHNQLKKLVDALCDIDGVDLLFPAPYFHEAVISLPVPACDLIQSLLEKKVLAGFDLSSVYPELDHALLICVTETKTDEDISHYCQCVKEGLASLC
jgi:glycine dehydrogenase subunit 1